MAGLDRGQVVAAFRRGAFWWVCLRGLLPGGQHREELTLLDGVADRDLEAADDAARAGSDFVLHLHRLEHDERFAGGYRIVAITPDRDDGAGEGGVKRDAL